MQSAIPDDVPAPKAVHVDLGHHILMGLYPIPLEQIGTDAVTILRIRIRRSRTNTATSFHSSKRIPCNGNGDFVLCSWDHGSVLLDNGDEAKIKWGELNKYQRCLWFIDEVEARWTLLQERHTGKLHFKEFNWSTDEDLNQTQTHIATFLSGNVRGSGKNQHTSIADFTPKKATQCRDWEQDYDRIMSYNATTRKLIARQRF